jgi:hypothetical protein
LTDPEDLEKAERVQVQAAGMPSLEDVARLAERAVAHGGTPDMPIGEVRELARTAVEQARSVTALLERLSDLLAPPQPPGGDQ